MSKREENLKKINAKLEKLVDEQLEDIAGGWNPPNWDKNYLKYDEETGEYSSIPPRGSRPIETTWS